MKWKLAGAVVTLSVIGSCGPDQSEHPAGAVPYPPDIQAVLEAQIKDETFATKAVRAALAEAGMRADLQPQEVRVSSYRGKPTACGTLVDGNKSVRFIYRDEGAVVESNHRREVFEEFWVSVCPLPLPSPARPNGG